MFTQTKRFSSDMDNQEIDNSSAERVAPSDESALCSALDVHEVVFDGIYEFTKKQDETEMKRRSAMGGRTYQRQSAAVLQRPPGRGPFVPEISFRQTHALFKKVPSRESRSFPVKH
jgi:hypothetical protein